jgi:hypothetical protein
MKVVKLNYASYNDIDQVDRNKLEYPMSNDNKGKDEFAASVCFEITLATPSNSEHRTMLPARVWGIKGTGLTSLGHPAIAALRKDQPTSLVHNVDGFFGRYVRKLLATFNAWAD